jgi:hypothetical protein
MSRKINPENPQARAKATSKDEATATGRKTMGRFWARKIGRKMGRSNGY